MPRMMSFAMTTQQFKNRSKDVTRRFGWWFLNPGDQVMAVEKAMGLRPGEKVRKLGLIEIVSARPEPLCAITAEDVVREGFAGWEPVRFIQMLVEHYRVTPDKTVNRIEFKYL